MSNKMILPAGVYWIGDPCYIFPNKGPLKDKWDELLAEVDFFEVSYGELDDGKIKVWAASTAYGDGCYISSNGIAFPVDSGLIGIVPQETVDYLIKADNDLNYCGLFIEFNESFIVESKNGLFHFGHIEINTGDKDDGDNGDDFYNEEGE